ncbi:MAG TPA: IclR family transcriptional regulator [Mycobacteriales bacterium]|nr:IclR family transcriptional regulator [Mycobacteriales bacterium]
MAERAKPGAPGGVQSVERAFGLLELMADAGGSQGLSQLCAASDLPLPTVHRLMRTLVGCGYVRQEPSRRYSLGPRLIRLGEIAGRMFGTWAQPHLARLVELTGETANLAMLDGDTVVYLVQAPGRHSMRMFTEPGRRVDPHCTAVGKALLAQLPTKEVRSIIGRNGLRQHTPTTITDLATLLDQLERIREQGFAVDEGEQEVGVRCLAVAVPRAPRAPAQTAVSVSGPQARLTQESVGRIVPVLAGVAGELAADFTESTHAPTPAS